jgi:hypothetical protein
MTDSHTLSRILFYTVTENVTMVDLARDNAEYGNTQERNACPRAG